MRQVRALGQDIATQQAKQEATELIGNTGYKNGFSSPNIIPEEILYFRALRKPSIHHPR